MKTSCFKKLMFIAIAFSMFNYGSRASAMEKYLYEDKNLNGYVLRVESTDITMDEIIKLLSDTSKPIVKCEIILKRIGAAGAKALANMLEHNTSLKSLDLSLNDIGVAGAKALANMLEHNTSLKSLDLSNNNIGAAGAEALANMLEHNTSLTSFDLSSNDIGVAGVKALANALEHNTSLTSLSLCNNKIGAAGAEAFANMLEHNTSLTSLNLFENKIGDAGAEAFANMLEHNTSLTSLSLCNNDIGDVGAEAFANMLKHNTSLTSFDLSENYIGAAGAEALANMLEHNLSLLWLGLDVKNPKNAKLDKALARNCLLKELADKILPIRSRNVHDILSNKLDPLLAEFTHLITDYVPEITKAELLELIMNGTIDQYVDATTLQKHQATIQKIKELHLAVISRAATTTNASASASSSSVNMGVSSGSTSSITSESASTTLMQEAQELFIVTVPLVAVLGSTAMIQGSGVSRY